MNKGELTELERVKLENFVLKHNALQQQIQSNLMSRSVFIEQVVGAHPGYEWDEQAGLVPKEAPEGSLIPVEEIKK